MLFGAAILAGVTYGVWWALDDLLGRSLIAQIVSVGAALARGRRGLRGGSCSACGSPRRGRSMRPPAAPPLT